MEYIGVIGIFIAIATIIFLTVKRLNIVIAAPLATLIVVLANQMNVFEAYLGEYPSYMTGLAGFLIKNFAIFLLGAILAQYMEKSRATIAIANFVLERVGTEHKFRVMVAFMAIAAVLTYGGISLFVVMFALVPLARPIFKRMDLNWALLPIPLFMGMATFTMSTLPGAPSVQNAVPTTYLGTSLTAAPGLSLVGTVVIISYGLAYMYIMLRRSLAKGETFYTYLEKRQDPSRPVEEDYDIDPADLPSIGIALIPIIVLIGINLIFSQVTNIILLALSTAILLAAILYRDYIPSNQELLNNGSVGAVGSAFATSSSVAFGTVLTSAAGFSLIQSALMSLSNNPLIGLSLATGLLGGITGSASGAIGIVMGSFGQQYIEMGIHPELLHRIATVASAIITVVPHSGVTITFESLSGTRFKETFWHQFFVVNGGHIVTLIVLLLVSSLFY